MKALFFILLLAPAVTAAKMRFYINSCVCVDDNCFAGIANCDGVKIPCEEFAASLPSSYKFPLTVNETTCAPFTSAGSQAAATVAFVMAVALTTLA